MGYRPRKAAKKHTMLPPVDLAQRSYLLSRLEWLLMLQRQAHKACSLDWSAFTAQVAINATLSECRKAGVEAEAWALLSGQGRAQNSGQIQKGEPRGQKVSATVAAIAS